MHGQLGWYCKKKKKKKATTGRESKKEKDIMVNPDLIRATMTIFTRITNIIIPVMLEERRVCWLI